MKRIPFLLAVSLFSLTSNAQQWQGSGLPTGLINRDGNVLIGSTPFQGTYGANDRVLELRGENSIVSFRSNTGSGSLDLFFGPAGGGTNFNSVGATFSLSTEYVSRLMILSNGNVGVGTSTPGYKFEVNGNAKFTVATVGNGVTSTPAGYSLYVSGGILTEKIKAALATSANWSDYVFDKKYHLAPLSTVEAYVAKNKHLPGVPSADELVKEGGVDMNEMFAKQMAKIEELTLYIIEQNKKIESMEKRVAQLEKKNENR